jgi:hypothetical protein
MKKLETILTDHLEEFIQEKLDLNKYEVHFSSWLMCEIKSGGMSR